MSDIQELTKLITKFRDARDWKQFHNPKDTSLSLVLEAAELMEHFQWKNVKEMESYVKSHKREISEELSDIFYWVLLMSYDLKINIKVALERKLFLQEKKYPIVKAKGNHTKYTEFK
jgi:NTP pyrophosphatase (non-canonical NTP hydrolase)